MNHSATMRRCLEDCDAPAARRLWAEFFPHLPQPQSDHEALATLHRARTEAQSMPLRLRAYSHRWLLDHGLPSGLPDRLRPRAERLYPRVTAAVGIAVLMRDPANAGAMLLIRGAMEYAVLEAEGDGKLLNDTHVSRRMQEARAKTKRQLFGR